MAAKCFIYGTFFAPVCSLCVEIKFHFTFYFFLMFHIIFAIICNFFYNLWMWL